jgi:hypothetical protein
MARIVVHSAGFRVRGYVGFTCRKDDKQVIMVPIYYKFKYGFTAGAEHHPHHPAM